MKVKKIKSTSVVSKVVFAVSFCALGWYLNNRFTPHFSNAAGHQTPYVLTAGLEKQDLAPKKKFIAEVEAINSVDIVPQVSGYLEKILFEDGAFVEQGKDIFLIEQRKYKADLQSAEATVKQLKNDYNRILSLHKSRDISDRERDLAESNLEQGEAALDLARLNLEYTEIKAPISGRIGKALVTTGNLVTPNTPHLARIVQTDPIRIVFSVSDKERINFLQATADSEDVTVDIALPTGEVRTVPVQNIFSGNEVNAGTATVPVYVDLANEDNMLLPGNYVDIYVHLGKKQEALLVPQVALSADVNGSYVMTIDANGIAHQTYIRLGDVIDDKQVVLSGLNGDEQVIIQGLQKVGNGTAVHATRVTAQE